MHVISNGFASSNDVVAFSVMHSEMCTAFLLHCSRYGKFLESVLYFSSARRLFLRPTCLQTTSKLTSSHCSLETGIHMFPCKISNLPLNLPSPSFNRTSTLSAHAVKIGKSVKLTHKKDENVSILAANQY